MPGFQCIHWRSKACFDSYSWVTAEFSDIRYTKFQTPLWRCFLSIMSFFETYAHVYSFKQCIDVYYVIFCSFRQRNHMKPEKLWNESQPLLGMELGSQYRRSFQTGQWGPCFTIWRPFPQTKTFPHLVLHCPPSLFTHFPQFSVVFLYFLVFSHGFIYHFLGCYFLRFTLFASICTVFPLPNLSPNSVCPACFLTNTLDSRLHRAFFYNNYPKFYRVFPSCFFHFPMVYPIFSLHGHPFFGHWVVPGFSCISTSFTVFSPLFPSFVPFSHGFYTTSFGTYFLRCTLFSCEIWIHFVNHSPPRPLFSLSSQTATSQLAGFRNNQLWA